MVAKCIGSMKADKVDNVRFKRKQQSKSHAGKQERLVLIKLRRVYHVVFVKHNIGRGLGIG